jgi:hypothetical protein
MKRQSPVPCAINLVSRARESIETTGWRSSHALGIIERVEQNVGGAASSRFYPVLMLAGTTLGIAFPTLELAHAFNMRLKECCDVGVYDLQEFFTNAGGKEKAREIIDEIKKAVESPTKTPLPRKKERADDSSRKTHRS